MEEHPPTHLQEELALALENEEYERAARIRDRMEAGPSRGPESNPRRTGEEDFRRLGPALLPVFGLLPEGERGGPDDDVVLATTARIVRNYAGTPFPASPRGGPTPSRERTAATIAGIPRHRLWRIAGLPPAFAPFLVERGLATRAWTVDPDSALAVNVDEPLLLIADGSDHLVIFARRPGLDVQGVHSLAAMELQRIAPADVLAFDPEFGWLSSQLETLGTGLQVSILLNLPALAFLGMTERVVGPLMEAGLAVKGMYGAEEGSAGDIFEVMTELSYGDGTERIATATGAAAGVAAAERRARGELRTRRGEELLDRAGRAIGLLRHARRLEQPEAAGALSILRLGALAGLVTGIDPAETGRYLGLLGPASLALDALGSGMEQPGGPDAAARSGALRAAVLRRLVAATTLIEGGQPCSRD